MTSQLSKTNQAQLCGSDRLARNQFKISKTPFDDFSPLAGLSRCPTSGETGATVGENASAARASAALGSAPDPFDDLPVHGGLDATVWLKRQLRRTRGYFQKFEAH